MDPDLQIGGWLYGRLRENQLCGANFCYCATEPIAIFCILIDWDAIVGNELLKKQGFLIPEDISRWWASMYMFIMQGIMSTTSVTTVHSASKWNLVPLYLI